MNTKLPLDLFNQAKRSASQDQPALFSWVTELDEIVSPVKLFKKAGTAFKGERFFWQNPEMTLTMTGFGVTKQFLAEKKKDAFLGLQEKIEKRLRTSVTNATIDATGPVYFGGFAFDPERDTEKEWQSFKDGLFYLPLFMLTNKDGKSYLTVNLSVYSDDTESKLDAVFNQWQKIIHQEVNEAEMALLTDFKEIGKEHFLETASEIIDMINHSEDVKKVVLARRMGLRFQRQVDSAIILENMLATQENSYFFLIEKGTGVFFGASPERLIAVNGDTIHSSCVAGSTERGTTEEADEALGNALLKDAKNLREHSYVVQMMEETLKPFTTGLSLSSQPVLLKNRDIQHLYMNISAKKNPDVTILEMVKALHPTPALGGLPQKMGLAIIRMKEEMDRGFYGAPIGWIDLKGTGEFAVAIRSGLIVDSQGLIYAGCGIVGDSVPKEELQETAVKFQPMLRVLGGIKK
ncbi:isochorismate synthase MenF [Listeria welshimeri]|nr:isochorismate synthase MenF [Listeria welshimeri]